MTAQDIKREVAQRENVTEAEVRCSHCACWAYNNGGVMTSSCMSRCKVQKHKTDNFAFCRHYTPCAK